MDESELLERIDGLVAEEQELRRREEEEGPGEAGRRRVEDIERTLDRLWDLLRQRRALRQAGRSADEASLRDAETVEDYEQ